MVLFFCCFGGGFGGGFVGARLVLRCSSSAALGQVVVTSSGGQDACRVRGGR